MHKMIKSRSIFQDPSDEECRYFKAVDRAFHDQEDRVISNGVPSHAVYLIYKFLITAKKSVSIYTGKLARSIDNVSVYQDKLVILAAIRFIRNFAANLSVVIADELDIPEGAQINQHPN